MYLKSTRTVRVYLLHISVMMQCLFIILFFTGVIPLDLTVPRKYYLIQQDKTWSDAQAYCHTNHIDLAIIQSSNDMVRLQIEIQRHQFSSSAWVGLYNDINNWQWSMGNELLGSTRLWDSGQPDNRQGVQQCGGINPGGWGDVECSRPLPFICFHDTETADQRYIHFSNTVTWHEAQAYCRSHYTDLASARNETESLIIAALTSSWTWFGLFRESWKWTDQTDFSTISWMTGQPDNAQGSENCGYLDNVQMADAQCSDVMFSMCYSDITDKHQIMRLRVMSNKDVNNVMDVILNKVKENLAEHGLAENITLKLRVQPDGKVFHMKKIKSTAENANCDPVVL